MDPQQKAVADEFDKYDRTYTSAVNDAIGLPGLKADFFTRVKANYLVELLTDVFGSAQGVGLLDVGCGVGNYHPLLKNRVRTLAGVDVSAACVERAASANPEVAYSSYDGTRLPYPDASFDAAVTICVMHHVPTAHWSRFAAEMARVVRPGGLVVVFEHNPRNPLTMRVVNRCPFDRDAVLLRAEQTMALLTGAGLQAVAASSILTIPAGNAMLRGIDRMFSWLPLGAQYYATGRKA